MTIEQEAKAVRILRQTQEVTNGNTTTASDAPTTVNMSVLSNATNYVDSNGIGHVKVNNDMGWSNILPNDSTVHIIYKESGPSGEILIIPAGQNASDATNSSFSGSDWMSGSDSTNPVNTLPTESSDDNVSRESKGLIRTGSSSVILVVVGTALALVAIVSVLAVVVYSRRNRRRAYSEDQSNSDQPFIVGSLPHQPVPQLSLLDTDMSPNLWLEGQYQYSPNMSGIRNSLNGTAILLDNSTAAMHHRYTVDARPSSRRGHRRNDGQGDVELDQRGNTGRNHAGYGNTVREDSGRDGSVRGNSVRDGSVRGNSVRDGSVRGGSARGNSGHVQGRSRIHVGRRDDSAWRERGVLDDISDRSRRRRGTTPIVLYDENSTEEHKSNPSRIHQHPRTSVSSQQQRQRLQEQQRKRRRDKYATRRDR